MACAVAVAGVAVPTAGADAPDGCVVTTATTTTTAPADVVVTSTPVPCTQPSTPSVTVTPVPEATSSSDAPSASVSVVPTTTEPRSSPNSAAVVPTGQPSTTTTSPAVAVPSAPTATTTPAAPTSSISGVPSTTTDPTASSPGTTTAPASSPGPSAGPRRQSAAGPAPAVTAAASSLLSISLGGGLTGPAAVTPGTTWTGTGSILVTDIRLVPAPGWTATVSLSPLVGQRSGQTLRPSSATYSASESRCTVVGSVQPATTVALAATDTAVKRASGLCASSWTMGVSITLPSSGVVADTYTGTLTQSIF